MRLGIPLNGEALKSWKWATLLWTGPTSNHHQSSSSSSSMAQDATDPLLIIYPPQNESRSLPRRLTSPQLTERVTCQVHLWRKKSSLPPFKSIQFAQIHTQIHTKSCMIFNPINWTMMRLWDNRLWRGVKSGIMSCIWNWEIDDE